MHAHSHGRRDVASHIRLRGQNSIQSVDVAPRLTPELAELVEHSVQGGYGYIPYMPGAGLV